ncbi:pilus assembly protein [Bradyrhizobium sp. WBAH42]|nr:pilus assembly protein TadG [Bradyrhizobium sp. WBAH30]MDD1541746.1 pilus assembly protein TadG [Bradyrhizobium sp. WBAH41]MDD1555388.1 pilus assembly protein TadG [Bradyrhizobium sp. WBAH23]MDD1564219.1 pilus assembly protein TadG [Bradyrhizobium sp. WBAH33]MDD1587813.1 pilus assembly protein TadG [Bradyrhizobium sp. WBAH42]NRB87215.1 pilus assembly protein TadG [Bradyrhizobium sp. WBAH10]QCJ89072.1 pilus assembly protein TadG [Bradyrhizobium yuanmingense]
MDLGGPMRAIANIWRNARGSVRGFVADKRALAATEFAIIVPLMLVMFFGTVEFSSAVAIDRKITLIARTLSDLTSQSTTLDDASMKDSFTASISVVMPYDATLVKGTISQIYIDANSVAKVQWSKAGTIASGATQATLATSTRTAGDTVTTMIPPTLLIPSSYLILSEVKYTYTPTIGYVLKSSVTLSDLSYTRPRQVVCVPYNNVPSTC